MDVMSKRRDLHAREEIGRRVVGSAGRCWSSHRTLLWSQRNRWLIIIHVVSLSLSLSLSTHHLKSRLPVALTNYRQSTSRNWLININKIIAHRTNEMRITVATRITEGRV